MLGSIIEMSHLDLGAQCVFALRFCLFQLCFRESSVVHSLTLVVVSVAQNDRRLFGCDGAGLTANSRALWSLRNGVISGCVLLAGLSPALANREVRFLGLGC